MGNGGSNNSFAYTCEATDYVYTTTTTLPPQPYNIADIGCDAFSDGNTINAVGFCHTSDETLSYIWECNGDKIDQKVYSSLNCTGPLVDATYDYCANGACDANCGTGVFCDVASVNKYNSSECLSIIKSTEYRILDVCLTTIVQGTQYAYIYDCQNGSLTQNVYSGSSCDNQASFVTQIVVETDTCNLDQGEILKTCDVPLPPSSTSESTVNPTQGNTTNTVMDTTAADRSTTEMYTTSTSTVIVSDTDSDDVDDSSAFEMCCVLSVWLGLLAWIFV